MAHVSEELLKQFHDGRLASPVLDTVSEHIATCDTCCAILDTLPNVALADRLRARNPSTVVSGGSEVLVTTQTEVREATIPLGQLGEYVLLEKLGEGGMGAVFRARHISTEQEVALKTIRKEAASRSGFKERFQREAKVLARLAKSNSDHIVALHYAGEENGVLYLVMPLLKGMSLEHRLQRKEKMSLAESLRVARQILLGLKVAHEAGILHRDLKPDNIFLEDRPNADEPFRAKLLDFGLAGIAEGTAVIASGGTFMGTPGYMSPEQANGTAPDCRSDLFAVGCVLYRMLTGRLPFPVGFDPRGKRGFPQGDWLLHLVDKARRARPPREYNAEIPVWLNELVLRLLEKDPARRPKTAQEVLRALESATPLQPLPRSWRPMWIATIAGGMALLILASFFAPDLIRIATNKGILEIEADDAKIEITIKGGEVTVIEAKTKRRFILAAGEDGEIEVREIGSEGLEVVTTTKQFRLERNGVQLLKASVILADAREIKRRRDQKEFVPILDPGGDIIDGVTSVAWHPTKPWIAVGHHWSIRAREPAVRIFDTTTGKVIQRLRGHSGATEMVAFSPNGKLLASGGRPGPDNLILWDVDTWKPLAKLTGQRDVVSTVRFSPDSSLLAVASGAEWKKGIPQQIDLLDVGTRKFLPGGATGNTYPIQSLSFSIDGKLLASADGWDPVKTRIWNVEDRKVLKKFTPEGPVFSVAFSIHPDDQELVAMAVGSTGMVHVVNAKSGAEVNQWQAHTKPGNMRVSFAPDGTLITAACDTGEIARWRVGKGTKLGEWRRPPVISNISISPDGRYAALGNITNGKVYLIRLDQPEKK